MGKIIVGALWGSSLVLCIWAFNVWDGDLLIIPVVGIIIVSGLLMAFVGDIIMEHWDGD
jgi:hypothetical protein